MKIKFLIYLLSFLMGLFFLVDFVFASTDGIIDPVYKYAWGERIGWINFGCFGCNVRITDSGLTGYVWSANYGWINLNPTNDGVNNNGEGILSGHAWGESLGWINFDGVQINSSGVFSGIANGPVSGQINFNCSQCQVRTDWRPRDVRPVRGGVMGVFAPLRTPEGGFRVLINQGAKYTDSSIVTLNLFGGLDADKMVISNFADFRDAGQETYKSTKDWNLCKGLIFCPEGKYTVYAKFYAPWELSSKVVFDSIVYKRKPFIERIPEILRPLVPEFLRPKPPEVAPEEIPIEELVPKETPLSFQGKWRLLPSEPIRKFVLAPLPREIRKLAEKFPDLGKIFREVGIVKITDIEKLKIARLTLPGLTERLGLPMIKIEPGKFALPVGIPVVELAPEVKEKIPTEIVFVKTAGEMIDFNITLTVTEQGKPIQKISTITNSPLQLVVRPEKPAESVKGYLVLRDKRISQADTDIIIGNRLRNLFTEPVLAQTNENIIFNFNLQDLTASLMFANPNFAHPVKNEPFVFVGGAKSISEFSSQLASLPVISNEASPQEKQVRFVLLEFKYIDPDKDGIYTAEIQTPVVEGEYEIITVIDYKDPGLGTKEIRLITLIDPEGYIYEKDRGREIRIPGAIVSIYWLNPETKQYELWPAEKFLQENPQITDVTGRYSFLVPEGTYFIKVEAPGYLVYEGKSFQVREGGGVHINIELKTQYWWLGVIDWKTIVIVIFGVLLFYNFYHDKIREKLLKKQFQ